MEGNNQTTATQAKAKHRNPLRRLLRTIKLSPLLILLILAVAAAVYFYIQDRDKNNKLKHPEIVAQAESDALVTKVNQLVVLPVGEKPTIYTVNDVSKLKTQQFFANAQNGDKVLLYAQAKKAYL